MLKFLIEACVHRRIAAVFFTLVVAAFGVRAYLDTPIEAFPDVTNAQVTVITQMPGYAAPEIERLITVPVERVLELAATVPGIRKPGPGVPMLSYLDIGLPPLDPVVMSLWQARNGQLYTDLGAANQIGMWVTRRDTGTTITVAYPDNPVARESVAQYVDLMKMVFLRGAEGRADSMSSPRIPRAAV